MLKKNGKTFKGNEDKTIKKSMELNIIMVKKMVNTRKKKRELKMEREI